MIKNQMVRLVSLILFLAVIVILSSKLNNKRFDKSSAFMEKEIIFDSIPIQPINNIDINIYALIKTKLKVLVYVNGNCSVCFQELSYWKEFLKRNGNLQNISFIFIIMSDNIVQSEYYIKRIIGFNWPIFYDKNNSFFKSNGLILDKNYLTFVLDKNNRVVFVGSPVDNLSIEEKIKMIIGA